MKSAPKPHNENERLKALNDYQILDTLEEQEYDDLTAIASNICQTPIALISLIDENRQWFKSHHGLEARSTPRDVAFCAHAILTPNEPFIIENSLEDERFFDNPLATDKPDVVFYAGIPLVNPDGLALGTLCVIDNVARKIDPAQIETLKALARQVCSLLDLRNKNQIMYAQKKTLENQYKDLEQFAYVVSHDLKSPLNNTKQLLNLIEMENLIPEQSELSLFFEKIKGSSEHMSQLIDGLLNYYRCDKFIEVEFESFNFNEVSNSILATLKPSSPSKKISLNIEPKTFNLYSSRIAWEHIFQNLFSNSIKFSDKEQILIDIEIRHQEKELQIIYTDNGQGIPEKHFTEAFTLFKSIPCRNSHKVKGSGIGLNAIEKLLTSLGGKIKLLPSSNGVKIFISLPQNS